MRPEIDQARTNLSMAKRIPDRRRLALMAAFLLLSGCAAMRPDRIVARPPICAAGPATVFVADGAGNFQMASQYLRGVVEGDGYPIDVVTYEWSHGNRRVLQDQTDYRFNRCQGIK